MLAKQPNSSDDKHETTAAVAARKTITCARSACSLVFYL